MSRTALRTALFLRRSVIQNVPNGFIPERLYPEAALDAATRAARDAAKKAEAIERAVYDLKAVNPHRKAEVDQRTPAELLDLIEAKGREVAEELAVLRGFSKYMAE
jgi:hypothetical protein